MASSEELGGGKLHTLTCDEVHQLIQNDQIVLIDVRSPAEFAVERIEGSLLAPMSTIRPGSLPVQEGGKPIVFHCGTGKRSKKVSEIYLRAGFSHVSHMDGGMMKWKAAKKPTIAIDFSTGAEVYKDPTATVAAS